MSEGKSRREKRKKLRWSLQEKLSQRLLHSMGEDRHHHCSVQAEKALSNLDWLILQPLESLACLTSGLVRNCFWLPCFLTTEAKKLPQEVVGRFVDEMNTSINPFGLGLFSLLFELGVPTLHLWLLWPITYYSPSENCTTMTQRFPCYSVETSLGGRRTSSCTW